MNEDPHKQEIDSEAERHDERATLNAGEEASQGPVINVPNSLVLLCCVLVSFTLVRLNPSINDALGWMVFAPVELSAFLQGVAGWGVFASLVTYSFLHAGWTHLLGNCFWLIVFGTPVVRRLGFLRFLILAAGGSIAGALAFYFLDDLESPSAMVGASAVVSAMMGAAARFALTQLGNQQAHEGRRLGLIETLTNKSALGFIFAFLLIQAFTAGGAFDAAGARIAWEAHIGGFLFGLIVFGLIDPQK